MACARSRRTRCRDDQTRLISEITQRGQEEVFGIARKALGDLADGQPRRAHGRGVHAPPARNGREGEGSTGARRSRHRPNRPSCAARLICRPSSGPRSKMRSTKPSPLRSASGSRPAGLDQRHRADGERTEARLEHRGLSRRRSSRRSARSWIRKRHRADRQAEAAAAEPAPSPRRGYMSTPWHLRRLLSIALFTGLREARETFTPQLTPREVGTSRMSPPASPRSPVCRAWALKNWCSFPGGLLGIAFNVDEEEIGVVLLGDYQALHAGDEVRAHRARHGRGGGRRVCWGA